MTDQPEPIRKTLLPAIQPSEWKFHTVFGARDEDSGCALFPGDTGPVVVRQRVTYGDWEPVRPDRWADEPAAAAPAVVSAPEQPTTHADVYAEVADRLGKDAETGDKEGLTRIYRRSAAKQVREWGEELRRMAGEEQPTARAEALREAADVLAALDPVEAALAGQHAWVDAAAVLRRLADETAALDLADGPVRCPLCPNPVTLHTPDGARAHFTHVHPEQQLAGPGPWPLLATEDGPAVEAEHTPEQQDGAQR